MKILIIVLMVLFAGCRENLWEILSDEENNIPEELSMVSGTIDGAGITANYEKYSDKLVITWVDPTPNKYVIFISYNSTVIVSGNNPIETYTLDYNLNNLAGNELLQMHFEEWDSGNNLVQKFSDITFQL